MKIVRVAFFAACLFPLAAFAAPAVSPDKLLEQAVRGRNSYEIGQAISQGATNADILLRQQLAATQTFNYSVVKALAENSPRGIDPETLNKIYVDFVIGGCQTGGNGGRPEFVKNISDFYSWDYARRDKRFRDAADMLAFMNPDQAKITSVVSCVAEYGGGADFLDFALESAERYKSENLKNVVTQIRDEIKKQKEKI
ncbi:MAG: hypothetical protein LBJ73_02230 [Rickettsiales bacterium]|jgi:hypothetical protein|nr:hypothetical protein [Rickettsiales bacterium]